MCHKRVMYVLHPVTQARVGNIFDAVGNIFDAAEEFWWCNLYSVLWKEMS